MNEFNIDSAIRYAPVVRLIKQIRNPSILEVGSGGSGLPDYLPVRTVGLDIDFAPTGTRNPLVEQVVGSVEKIPFPDDHFDVVLSMDMMEHLTKEMRENGIKEMIRVTKPGGLLLCGFPEGEEARMFDKRLNERYKKKFGKDHHWLREHIANGLPATDEFSAFATAGGAKNVTRIPNINVWAWYVMHLVNTVNVLPKSHIYRKATLPIFRSLNFKPYYRAIYRVEV